MVQMIKGQTVVLYTKTQTSTDAFGAPIYTETPSNVENVLIAPTTAEEVVSDVQMYGKHSVYTLHIPKGDSNDWSNVKVNFFGQDWRTFGAVTQYQEELLPLDWNKKVRVEKYE